MPEIAQRHGGSTLHRQNNVPCGYRSVAVPENRRLVDQHFETIARRYDLANTLLSLGLDHRWRKFAIRRLALKRGECVLDLCGGTAALAAHAARDVAPDGRVTVCDLSMAMMRAGLPRVKRGGHTQIVQWIQGDAEKLGFPDGTFDAVMVGFGVRNLVHLERGLKEMCRVLRRGGRLMLLEFSVPEAAWFRNLYGLYSFALMPIAGKAITGASAPFRYLAESIRVFPTPEVLKATLETSGFRQVMFWRLNMGIVAVYLATRSQ